MAVRDSDVLDSGDARLDAENMKSKTDWGDQAGSQVVRNVSQRHPTPSFDREGRGNSGIGEMSRNAMSLNRHLDFLQSPAEVLIRRQSPPAPKTQAWQGNTRSTDYWTKERNSQSEL